MELTTLIAFMLGLVVGEAIAAIVVYRHEIWHRIKFKKMWFKCPTCNGEGTIAASDGPLLRLMMKEGSDEAMKHAARFECSECKGKKKVCYEFPRLQKVEVDDEGRIIGNYPQNPLS